MAMEYDGHVKAQQAGQGVGLLMFLQSPWAAFAWFVWRLDFFYQEGFVNPAQFEGSAFWSLLAVLLTWCALLPTLLAVPLIAKRGRTTTPEWNGKVALFLHVLLPASLIFSTLFLWAFPHQWGLLPWKGPFYDDLWKIGPFIGLFSFHGRSNSNTALNNPAERRSPRPTSSEKPSNQRAGLLRITQLGQQHGLKRPKTSGWGLPKRLPLVWVRRSRPSCERTRRP